MTPPEGMLDGVERYCMFFGYPRSGHTLTGSLLNAHPEVLISIELDALSRLREGVDRRTLFEEIWAEDQRFAARDRAHMGYDYAVPGAWQGAPKRVRVIGDKKGGRSSWWLHDEPALLDRLYEVVALPVRFIHVSRSPWDNIATIVRRGMDPTRAIEWYFETCDAVAGIKARIPAADVLDLRHEDFLHDPRAHLRGLCRFLEVRADEAWIEACLAVIDTRPRRSRHELPWSAEQIAWVQREVVRFPWFRESDLDLAGGA